MNEDECVANGIALLDKKSPGWRAKVDADKIDLNSCTECVLGQVFKAETVHNYKTGYGVGIMMLDLRKGTGVIDGKVVGLLDVMGYHGFDVQDMDSKDYDAGYQRLTEAWKRALTKEQTS